MASDLRDTTLQFGTEAASCQPLAAALGAVVGGLAALSCCVAPLVFVLIGFGGAWIANLTALSPYQPAFVVVAIGSIVYGHIAVYRARRACASTSMCVRPLTNRLVDTGLWAGTLFVAVALAANLVGPHLL